MPKKRENKKKTREIKEERNKNIQIDLGKEVFYANGLTIFNNQNEFVLDFTQVSPKMDFVDGKQILNYVVKHNTIVLTPKQAKIFLQVLRENIEKFEKQFGEIEISQRKEKKEKSKLKGVIERFSNYIG